MGAKQILGDENIAFMTGEPHKNLRKRILPLFTPRALSIFLRVQGTCSFHIYHSFIRIMYS